MDTFSRLAACGVVVLMCTGTAWGYGLVSTTAGTQVTGIQAALMNAAVNGGPYTAASEDAACLAVMNSRTAVSGYPFVDYYNPNSPFTLSAATGVKTAGSSCVVRRCQTAIGSGNCVSFAGTPAGLAQALYTPPATCPANSTSSGANCVCNLGFKGGTFGGASAAPSCTPYSCEAKSLPSFSSSTPITTEFGCESSGPNAGCVSREVPDAFTSSTTGVKTYFGHSVITGAACQEGGTAATSPTTPPPQEPVPEHPPTEAEKCALGRGVPMCTGTVNGASVCVACGSSEGTKIESTTTPAGAASAPVGVTPGKVTTSTNCTGAACTQTRTTTDGGGTVTSVTTTTGPVSQLSPGNGSGAGGEEPASQFGGSCSAGAAAITCDGDAIQCSIAREQFRRQCEFFEKTSDESNAAIAAKTAGVQGAADHPARTPTTTSLAGGFDQTNLIAGSCPADRTLTVGQAVILVPFSQVCGPATLLGNLLVGLTALACIAIVFKGS